MASVMTTAKKEEIYECFEQKKFICGNLRVHRLRLGDDHSIIFSL